MESKTVRIELIDRLIKMGMFETQAQEVVKAAEPMLADSFEGTPIELDKDCGYAPYIYNLLLVSIKPIALKWIEENKPQAWFKPMFQ